MARLEPRHLRDVNTLLTKLNDVLENTGLQIADAWIADDNGNSLGNLRCDNNGYYLDVD